jgi:hypothetical protein
MTEEGIVVQQPFPERLTEMLASLSPEQQSAVETFIRYLQQRDQVGSSTELQGAIDEFLREHSDLLRQLAQ